MAVPGGGKASRRRGPGLSPRQEMRAGGRETGRQTRPQSRWMPLWARVTGASGEQSRGLRSFRGLGSVSLKPSDVIPWISRLRRSSCC